MFGKIAIIASLINWSVSLINFIYWYLKIVEIKVWMMSVVYKLKKIGENICFSIKAYKKLPFLKINVRTFGVVSKRY